jgi:hypothetical protein
MPGDDIKTLPSFVGAESNVMQKFDLKAYCHIRSGSLWPRLFQLVVVVSCSGCVPVLHVQLLVCFRPLTVERRW